MRDRRPLPFEDRFLWHPQPDDAADEDDYLPREMFDRLDGFIPRENPLVSQMVKAYRTEQDAMRALNLAMHNVC